MRAALTSSGYEAVTIEGLAEVAGVSKQTIYRWWPSKAAILGEALLDGRMPGLESAPPATDDLEADLREWFVRMSAQMKRGDGVELARALIAVTATDPVLGLKLNELLAAPIRDWVADRFARAREAGELREEVDPAAVAEQIVAISSYAALLDRPLTPQYVDAVVDVLLHGISARR